MIHEYALEPELVATWTDRKLCRFFKDNFNLVQGRVVSRCPRCWKNLVWEAFDSTNNSTNDIAQKRLEELLECLSKRMVRRTNIQWDTDTKSWLENAEREHERRPFHAILARTNSENHAHVLTENDIIDGDSAPLWTVESSCSVKRNAVEMARVMAPMLKCSSVVIFIDPYFDPGTPRYQRPFEAFLEQMVRQRPSEQPKRIEVHTSTNRRRRIFFEKCDTKLHKCVPEGMKILVRRLKQKQDGEKLHNRYILTDLGGVAFGIGLDDGDGRVGETDDITLMDRGQYELRWSQYGGDPPAEFEQEGNSIVVKGTRRLFTLS